MDAAYPGAECVNVGEAGRSAAVIVETLHRLGARGSQLHALSLGSVGLCIGLWIRAKTVDQDERGNAERRALFVGLGHRRSGRLAIRCGERETSPCSAVAGDLVGARPCA
jgi:hypothetical protein